MAEKNYFIKDDYVPNLMTPTHEKMSDEVYWNDKRIRNSAFYNIRSMNMLSVLSLKRTLRV